jgi:hypothetical protein
MAEPSDDIVAQSADLSARVHAAGGPDALISTLAKGVKRQKRALWLLAVSVFIDLCLTGALTVAFSHINANTVTAKNSCKAGNDFRTDDRKLWEFVVALPTKTSNGTTLGQLLGPANEKTLDGFLDTTFALRKC